MALKGLLFQMKDLPKFWYLNKLDGIVWVGTFLAVTFVSIDIGLGVGIVMSLAVILIRGIKPYACLLGNVPGTELYLDIKRYKGVSSAKIIKNFNFYKMQPKKHSICSFKHLIYNQHNYFHVQP